MSAGTSPSGRGSPTAIAIVVPMRNEEERIERLVASVAAQDYQGSLRLLIADGASTDRSVEQARSAAARLGVDLEVVENVAQRTASGLNRCLERANAELIVRMDCRARFAEDYVTWCVRTSEETGAENVGGPTLVEGRTAVERAVACGMTSPFGGIGWSRETGAERHEHDTVYCGAFLASVFERIGGFDETLGSNEDDELNLRLRKAGGRVILDRRIRLWYTPRGRLRDVFTQYYRYGLWKPAVMFKHRSVLGLRSLVPAAFVVTLTALGVASLFSARALVALGAVLAVYGAAAVAFAARALRRRGEPLRLLPVVVGSFVAFHLGYGAGLIAGAATVRSTEGRAR
jgi:glycosyltransferase involved in cell wall biosynthesis